MESLPQRTTSPFSYTAAALYVLPFTFSNDPLLLSDDVFPQPSDRAGIRGRISSSAFAAKTEGRTNQAIGTAGRGWSRAATGTVQDCEHLSLFNSKCSFL